MARDDGGPAFPRPMAWIPEEMAVHGITADAQDGMTLRDWFAGQALSGMYSDGCPANTIDAIASDAYRIADAMIRAREEQT